MKSRVHDARVAGVLYLLMSITAVVSLGNVPSWVMAGGDATATASRIAASQLLYRIGIVGDLAAQILFVLLAVTLFRCSGCSRKLTKDMLRSWWRWCWFKCQWRLPTCSWEWRHSCC